MAEPAAIRYRAFMSYSHHDTTWAKWLHKALEDYRIDKDLVGRETPLGALPKTLRPIFRDREDFSGGSTLTEPRSMLRLQCSCCARRFRRPGPLSTRRCGFSRRGILIDP